MDSEKWLRRRVCCHLGASHCSAELGSFCTAAILAILDLDKWESFKKLLDEKKDTVPGSKNGGTELTGLLTCLSRF